MNLIETKTSKLRLFLRELIGFYRYFKAKMKYRSQYHPVYKSDNPKTGLKQNHNEPFDDFFMRVEKKRNTTSEKVSKNVRSSLTYFSSAITLLPFLISKCNLKAKSKVLDYGSGGLRCGFGLLDYLDNNCYSCADITSDFFHEALKNSFLLSKIFKYKSGTFYKINQDKIPSDYYDIVISTYVVPHIPRENLFLYFKSINNYLKNNGLFYFDFLPAPFYLSQNSITFTYSYKLIFKILVKSNFKIISTYGSSIVAQKFLHISQ